MVLAVANHLPHTKPNRQVQCLGLGRGTLGLGPDPPGGLPQERHVVVSGRGLALGLAGLSVGQLHLQGLCPQQGDLMDLPLEPMNGWTL